VNKRVEEYIVAIILAVVKINILFYIILIIGIIREFLSSLLVYIKSDMGCSEASPISSDFM